MALKQYEAFLIISINNRDTESQQACHDGCDRQFITRLAV